MKAFLTTVSIYFSLFGAGESLVCECCINYNGSTCYGDFRTCDANSTSCEDGALEWSYGGITTSVAFKTCTPFPICHNYFFSETIGDFKFQMQKNCCTTDNCNAQPIVLPPRNNTPNGVECPLCYVENATTPCEATETMQCTGLETKCQNFVGKVQNNDSVLLFASRNCISKEPCEANMPSWQDAPFLEVIHFSCDGDDKDDDDDDNDKHDD